VVEQFEKFLNEDGLTPAHRCIVGHNIYTFDKKFLFALWESVGKEFPAHLWLDTIHLTKQFIKNSGIDKDCKAKGIKKPKVNLHASCDLVGIKKISTAHSAKSDTRNTYLLWKDLVDNKGVDYLPHIKTAIHYINPPNPDDECGLDPALLDNDVETESE
jgi:DNA polymerase III epsilon subunit-like protein